ncbi:MAG: isochorismatase family protein [Candidatus Binatia bacterium]
MAHPRLLDRARSALVVIDVQEGYRGHTVDHERMVHGVRTLLAAAALLEVPVIATEQYPKGLGRTQPEVRERLPAATPVIEKLSMSCCGQPRFVAAVEALARAQIVVCGIEAHACLNQTVHDLLARGYQVHVPRDAISARQETDLQVGWEKIVGSGAVPATVEMVCLEWIRTAESPQFKAIHALIK